MRRVVTRRGIRRRLDGGGRGEEEKRRRNWLEGGWGGGLEVLSGLGLRASWSLTKRVSKPK